MAQTIPERIASQACSFWNSTLHYGTASLQTVTTIHKLGVGGCGGQKSFSTDNNLIVLDRLYTRKCAVQGLSAGGIKYKPLEEYCQAQPSLS